MITLVFDSENVLVQVRDGFPPQDEWQVIQEAGGHVEDRNDWKTFDHANVAAIRAEQFMGKPYIAVDRGDHVHPRFDVIAAPQVGDDVSQSFNGDSYPCGKIVSISPSMGRIETSDGTVFTRRKPGRGSSVDRSALWIVKGSSCFSMIPGHHDRRNPHF